MLRIDEWEVVFHQRTRQYPHRNISDVFRIAIPPQRIFPDVFPDGSQLFFVADNVLPIVPLPHRFPPPTEHPIDLDRRQRLERANDLAERHNKGGSPCLAKQS